MGMEKINRIIVRINVNIPTKPSQEEVLLIEKLKEIYDSKKAN
jgi:hypothetical protein